MLQRHNPVSSCKPKSLNTVLGGALPFPISTSNSNTAPFASYKRFWTEADALSPKNSLFRSSQTHWSSKEKHQNNHQSTALLQQHKGFDRKTARFGKQFKSIHRTIKPASTHYFSTQKMVPTKILTELSTSKRTIRSKKPRQFRNLLTQLNTDNVVLGKVIGQGTFGKVYLATVRHSSQQIAVKVVEENPKVKNREAHLLMLINSRFIVPCLGVYTTKERERNIMHIAMELYEVSLYEHIQKRLSLSDLRIKLYLYQMVRGLVYLHSKDICHRDIKPHNMFLKGYRLVMGDLGSAKKLTKGQGSLSYICSRYYRAPELLLGCKNYDCQIDMWSLGCIVLEMIGGQPYFAANTTLHQLVEIVKTLGTPTKSDILSMNPECDPNQLHIPDTPRRSLSKIFPDASDDLIDLVTRLLTYSPKLRLTAVQALAHNYFDELRCQSMRAKLTELLKTDAIYLFQFGPELQNLHASTFKIIPKWAHFS